MSTHTSGPWKLDPKTLRVMTGDTDEFDQRMPIASVNGGKIHDGQGDENARLIAKAPTMMRAILKAIDAIEKGEMAEALAILSYVADDPHTSEPADKKMSKRIIEW